MLRWRGRLLGALLLYLPALACCQGPVFNTTRQNRGQFRVIINRTDKTGVFSGDFNHGGNTSENAVATLNRTFTSNSVGVEVFNVASEQLSPAQLCSSLKDQNQDVTSCEPDFLVSTDAGSATPNDPNYPQQWNMPDIQMPTAWKTGQFGSSSVRTCMIDTGTDFTHPDLIPNLWKNPKEVAGPGANEGNGWQNGIDDDGNGIIDDIYGANFVDGSKDGNCQDQNGHGTFVAGVVGAVGNNNLGVTGINQNASIVTCRFMDATGNGWVSDAIRCLDYCMSFDSHVISNSWGGVAYSDSLQTAINQAASRGVLAVCSAGNDAENTDTTAHYPSSLPDEVILSVGASVRGNDSIWNRSNYGNKTVDMLAPGVSVLSTGLGGLYITLSGTSMSTPHVAGVASLMLAQYLQNGFNISTIAPNKGLASDLKKLILSSADPVPGAQVSSGHLNAGAALALVPLAAVANTESFGGNAPPGGVGAVEAYNPTQGGGATVAFGNGGPGGLGGTAQVSIDMNNETASSIAPTPSNGFEQELGPAAAAAGVPPLPAAVQQSAASFQQAAATTFGRRLQEGGAQRKERPGGPPSEQLVAELRQSEARLRDALADGGFAL